MQVKLGRKERSHDSRIPHLSAILAGVPLPTPAAVVDNSASLPVNVGMMLNDVWGDCAEAGFFHARQVWSKDDIGIEYTASDQTVSGLYSSATDFNPNAGPPGSNPTDQGTNLQQLLTYLMTTGALLPNGARHKILGFIEVDPTNDVHLDIVTQEFGCIYLGFNVPSYLMASLSDAGSTWGIPGEAGIPADADSSIDGGHCVISSGYKQGALRRRGITSWGTHDYAMTGDFWTKYVDEAYAIFDPLWIANKGHTPLNLNASEIDGLMAALRNDADYSIPILRQRRIEWALSFGASIGNHDTEVSAGISVEF